MVLLGHAAKLFEPGRKGAGRLPLLDLGEGLASPKREGLLEQPCGGDRVGSAAGRGERALEAQPVDVDDIGVQPVAPGHRHHRRRAEPLAEARDVVLQADRGARRARLAERRLRQGIERRDLTRFGRQSGQHATLEDATELDLDAVGLLDTEPTERAEEHGAMVRRPTQPVRKVLLRSQVGGRVRAAGEWPARGAAQGAGTPTAHRGAAMSAHTSSQSTGARQPWRRAFLAAGLVVAGVAGARALTSATDKRDRPGRGDTAVRDRLPASTRDRRAGRSGCRSLARCRRVGLGRTGGHLVRASGRRGRLGRDPVLPRTGACPDLVAPLPAHLISPGLLTQ